MPYKGSCFPQNLQEVSEVMNKVLLTLGIIISGAIYFIRNSYQCKFPIGPTDHFGLHKNVIHGEVKKPITHMK